MPASCPLRPACTKHREMESKQRAPCTGTSLVVHECTYGGTAKWIQGRTGHGEHWSILLAPLAVEYLPTPQASHAAGAEAFNTLLQRPATQGTHVLEALAPLPP